ncbi:MAG: cache domain-containing protein [Nitrososphaerota archaeon]
MFVNGIIIGIVLFLGLSSILLTLAINQNTSFTKAESEVAAVKEADNNLLLITDVIENRLEKAAAILEFTSRLPEMREPLLLGLFSPVSKGIPEKADLNRRQIAQEILSKYPEEFVSLLFLMPNGTVYLLEPFARQQNLSTYDLSFRDYYKAATESNHTLLSNVIRSLSTGSKQAQMTLPIFNTDDANQTISRIGVLSGGLNLKTYNEILQSLKLNSQERIVLLDSNGTKIADSDAEQQPTLLKSTNADASFRNLKSFNNAIKGETGKVQEIVNGSNTEIEYKPVKAIQKNWVLLLFRNTGASDLTTYPNLGQTGNSTVNIPSNGTVLNCGITNNSNSCSLNTTIPEQLPPQSINGSKVPKI